MAVVLNLPDPAQIEPVAGWALKGTHGHMAFETTMAGRLVSLADLVAWLMETSGLPCSMAVDAVCEKLEKPGAAEWLYMVAPGALAQPLRAGDCFAWWPLVDSDIPYDPKTHGLTGAVNGLRSMWGASASPSECEYIGHEYLSPLAIRMDVAHALWGWGVLVAAVASTIAPVSAALGPDDVSSAETLVRYRQQFKGVAPQKRPPWTSAHRAYLAEAVRFHGGAAELAKQLGVSAQAVRDQFNKASAEAETRKQANAFTGLVQPSNKAA